MIFTIPVLAVDKTVTQNVAVSILAKLEKLIGNEGILTFYTVDDEGNYNYNVDSVNDRALKPKRLNVSYVEDSSEFDYTPARGSMVSPIVSDRDIVVSPVYYNSKLDFKLTFSSKSKVEVKEVIGILKRLQIESRMQHEHTVEYRYYISRDILQMIFIIYKLKEPAIGGTFQQYFESIMSDRVSLAFSQDGTPKEMIVLERQLNVLGTFTDNLTEQSIELNKETGNYQIDINYSVTYNKVEYVDVRYKYVINNKLIPKELVVIDDTISTTVTKYLGQIHMERIVDNHTWLYKALSDIPSRGYISIPRFDVESNIDQQQGMMNVFSVLTLIEETNKKDLFYLTQLGDVSLTTQLIDYLRMERENLVITNGALFNIALYEDNEMSDIELVVSEDLLVSAVTDLDMSKVYRVIVRIVPNIDRLRLEAKNRLILYTENDKGFFKNSVFTDVDDWFHNKEYITKSNCLFNFNLDLTLFENEKMPMYTVLTSYLNAIMKG